MNNVEKLLKSLDIKNEPIIVACSGGPDSMFLLYTLKRYGYNVICAHVNHHLRKESDDEYKMVEKYCLDNNIIFEGIELFDLPKVNTEIVARIKRYDFFKKLIIKYNSRYLFTAHHGDDLIETVIMRIVRGSTLNGYSGFNVITNKGYYKIVRPFVYLTKDYIIKKCDKNNIPYAIDLTNLDDKHTRNRYRHKILPVLKEEDKNVHLKFLKYHNLLQEYYDYVNTIVYKEMDRIFINDILDIDEFNKLDKLIKNEMLREIIRIYYPNNLYLIGDNNINEIIKVINSNKPSIILNLPNGLKIIKEYNKLIFNNNLKDLKLKSQIMRENEVIIPTGIIIKENDDRSNSNYVIRLNSKDIVLPIVIRSRIPGDKMYIKNMNGCKKINDIFIDSKVPKELRDIQPIVCDSKGEILWIPGLKKSKFDIQMNGNYDIILKYVKGEKKNAKS